MSEYDEYREGGCMVWNGYGDIGQAQEDNAYWLSSNNKQETTRAKDIQHGFCENVECSALVVGILISFPLQG